MPRSVTQHITVSCQAGSLTEVEASRSEHVEDIPLCCDCFYSDVFLMIHTKV